MTKLTVKFMLFDGSNFYQTFFIQDDECAKDIIETFIYEQNKNEYRFGKMCTYNYNYDIVGSERI